MQREKSAEQKQDKNSRASEKQQTAERGEERTHTTNPHTWSIRIAAVGTNASAERVIPDFEWEVRGMSVQAHRGTTCIGDTALWCTCGPKIQQSPENIPRWTQRIGVLSLDFEINLSKLKSGSVRECVLSETITWTVLLWKKTILLVVVVGRDFLLY